MDDNFIPYPLPHMVFREEFDDWAILFDPDTCQTHGLNPVAVQIWKQMDGKNTLADIIQKVLPAYTEVPENASLLISDFIQDLLTFKYIGRVVH